MNFLAKRYRRPLFSAASRAFASVSPDLKCSIFHNNDIVHAYQNIYVESYPRLTSNLFQKLLKHDEKIVDHEYKFFLDFNDNKLAGEFLSAHSDLYRICVNPKSENLIKGCLFDLPLFLPSEKLFETEDYKILTELLKRVKGLKHDLYELEWNYVVMVLRGISGLGRQADLTHLEENVAKNLSILSNILKNTFNFALIYSDRYYFETTSRNQKIIEKIPKFPISFDLNLFHNFYDPKKEKSGYKEFVNYLYEMGESMKMLSLRQINEQSLTSSEKAAPINPVHFDNGFVNLKDLLDIMKLNNFKGFFLFNEEDVDLMAENYTKTIEIFKKSQFLEKEKGEVLARIKAAEADINIGFFL